MCVRGVSETEIVSRGSAMVVMGWGRQGVFTMYYLSVRSALGNRM